MIDTKNLIFKPVTPFTYQPNFKDWAGVSYQEETVNGKRHYTIDGIAYPSITTVLSYDPIKKEILRKWRKKVGEQEANKISKAATTKGSSVHKLCENYLTKNEVTIKTFQEQENFLKVKGVMESRIGPMFCIETALYSHELGVAGRCDLISLWKDEKTGEYCPAVIDFKTSNREKRRGMIDHYFIQGAAYAKMFEHMTGIEVPKVVIIMATEELNYPQIFEEQTCSWVFSLNKAITTYRENANGNTEESGSCAVIGGI